MSKFNVDYEMQVSVQFHDEEKALEYLQGEFSEGFWEIEDLEEGATSVANQFIYERDSLAKEIFLEGFGGFARTAKRDVWENNEHSKECMGKVTIELEYELESTGAFEVQEKK